MAEKVSAVCQSGSEIRGIVNVVLIAFGGLLVGRPYLPGIIGLVLV